MVVNLPSSSSRGGAEPNKGRFRTRQPVVAPNRTEFYGSQVGGESVINYGYTDMPLKLLLWDIRTFFTYLVYLPWIVWPLRPCEGEHFNELAFTRANVFCLFIHGILIVLQLGFLASLPVLFLLPVWVDSIGLAVFFSVNWLLCRTLNGKDLVFNSDPEFAPALEEHAHEKWVFLNGVAVGQDWMMSNINRLALTFKRPVQGIHNKTSGIIFDVIECLVQRNYTLATSDVREAYRTVKGHLYNPQYSKVVFILHSQGGIEGGLVLDWLLQELPQDLLAKLEVYTFGCAANHFNNPHRHVVSQTAQQNGPSAINTAVSNLTRTALTDSPVEIRTPVLTHHSTSKTDAGFPTPTSTVDSYSLANSITTVPASDRAIGHIEHYAHTYDFVARWGVLHFVSNERASRTLPRFIGRVFSRTSARGGHQFCQHYLDGMFPLERKGGLPDGEFVGCRDTNEFMESVVELARNGCEHDDLREGFEKSCALIGLAGREGSTATTAAATNGFSGAGVGPTEVEVHGSFHDRNSRQMMRDGKVRVKDLSRLWQYRNGQSPPELPQGLRPDADGVVRAGTL
ncbi:hypothetical protein BX600DRAFT_484941 [Xylariales sp. PMI_506]|nr:hypothetical protein BX600DRAFT_484941 [Xylariales sp. PMI_506]